MTSKHSKYPAIQKSVELFVCEARKRRFIILSYEFIKILFIEFNWKTHEFIEQNFVKNSMSMFYGELIGWIPESAWFTESDTTFWNK